MQKTLLVLLGLVLLAGVVGLATTTPVVPRAFEDTLLFDNETGSDVIKLAIIFDKIVAFDASDIVVFGGGVPTLINDATQFAFIDVTVAPGGTFQLVLPEGYEDAVVVGAHWF